MQLRSVDIVSGRIAKPLACVEQGGQDRSPQLTVGNLPAAARYLAIVVDDPDAQPVAGKTWVHWNRVNVDARAARIDAGRPPPGDELVTSFGTTGYGGMCPPNGVHRYRFAVYAMKDRIDVKVPGAPSELTLEAFEKRYKAMIVSRAVIEGRF